MRSMRKTLLMAAMSCCLPMFAVEDAGGGTAIAPNATGEQGNVLAANAATQMLSESSATSATSPAPIDQAAPAVSAPSVVAQLESASASQSSPVDTVAVEAGGDPAQAARVGLIHSLLDSLETKLATGVHVFAHEVAAIREHIKAIL